MTSTKCECCGNLKQKECNHEKCYFVLTTWGQLGQEKNFAPIGPYEHRKDALKLINYDSPMALSLINFRRKLYSKCKYCNVELVD
jgi:sporulation-control protein spo0M